MIWLIFKVLKEKISYSNLFLCIVAFSKKRSRLTINNKTSDHIITALERVFIISEQLLHNTDKWDLNKVFSKIPSKAKKNKTLITSSRYLYSTATISLRFRRRSTIMPVNYNAICLIDICWKEKMICIQIYLHVLIC